MKIILVNRENLGKLLSNFIIITIYRDIKEKSVRSYDDKIVKNLKLLTKLEVNNLNPIIRKKNYDVLTFVVDTDYDKSSENISRYMNLIAQRFKLLGIKSVLLTYYDVNENKGNFIHEKKAYNTGDIFLSPANSKQVKMFSDKLTVSLISLIILILFIFRL